jgi:hypothetical protein
MTQNVISISFTEADLTAIDSALAALEEKFAVLVTLTNEEKRALSKMGTRGETFIRETLVAMEQNPDLIPPTINLAEARIDLTALDVLRPRVARLNRLVKRGNDTMVAIGSDLDAVSRLGYKLVDTFGPELGLEELRRSLSARFARKRKAAAPKPEGEQDEEDKKKP